jgi:hypothetical protein
MMIHQITTAANAATNAHLHLGRRAIHNAQIANKANAIAATSRIQFDGKFE